MPADITTGNTILDLRGTDFVDPQQPKRFSTYSTKYQFHSAFVTND
ncbi:hypothetical protein I4641_05405 [Waterburya agarophytonicola K14]|uniref:Uncharacterized protein n=1 Tax=Waterburya agarophytonicola KI4 TaxID=2874699 RepID=A0A964FGD2_9CYAN|nr:hypothetical protein [Waterburya agarophytonicola]MCC0176413.1 hypothetical protein [Waterburya agarophytonicola KI4]